MTAPIPPQIPLRALREAFGMTLEELHAAIREQGVEVSVKHINNVELGHRQGNDELMEAWARALRTKRLLIRQGDELVSWLQAITEPVAA